MEANAPSHDLAKEDAGLQASASGRTSGMVQRRFRAFIWNLKRSVQGGDDMSQGFYLSLVSEVVSSWVNEISLDMMVAKNVLGCSRDVLSIGHSYVEVYADA